jgi:hypothetical protein
MATWAQHGVSFIPQQGSGPMSDQQQCNATGQVMMMPTNPMTGGDCPQQQGNTQQPMMMMPACMPMQSGGSNGMQSMMMMPMMQGMNGQQPMMMPMQMQGGNLQQPMMMPMQMQGNGQQPMMMPMQGMQAGGQPMMMMMMMVPQNGQMMMQPMMMMQPASNGQQQQQQTQQCVDVDSNAPSSKSEQLDKPTPAGPPGAFAASASSKQSKTCARDGQQGRSTRDAKPAALTAGALVGSADTTSSKSASDRRELLTKQASEVVARLRRSGARRSDLAATQLRHSTFSALNLEVTGGTRKGLQPLSRQSIAELQSEWAASKAKRAAAEASKVLDSGASTASTMPSEEEVAESSQDEDAVAGTFSIKSMLRMRCSFLKCPIPAEISSLSAADHELGWQKGDSPRLRGMTPLAGSAVAQPTRIQQLQRDVNSLLNKVCPESVTVITQRVAGIEIKSAEELQVVIGLIFKKALAEPHYCETYADMVLALKQCMPEFPSPTGNKPITFKAALLNTTQSEFEALSQILTITAEESNGLQADEIDTLRKKRRDRARGNMRFIGQLFLRALLGSRIIESIIKDLVKCEDPDLTPEEAIVECVCELLQNTGYTLECSGEAGKASLSKVCDKLCAIKGKYSKRIQFGIQDVLDIRGAGWKKKSFKASAKTKGEIRREQEQDLWAAACGRDMQRAEVQIAGARRVVTGW